MKKIDSSVVKRWEKALDGIKDQYMAEVTAQLLENQAKAVLAEVQKMNEDTIGAGATTTGKLGTFQKFAFPLVRRIYPELIFNKIGATQPMEGPVSQIFYLGNSRYSGQFSRTETVYSKMNVTYMGMQSSSIGSVSSPGTGGTWHSLESTGTPLLASQASSTFDISSVLGPTHGGPSTTYGGKIASWPNASTIYGWAVSAGERLATTGIPEVTFHIQQQPVVARTRKMRAMWTIEAAQDLKAYHNLDLERELTDLLSKEISLEIDRELIEDIRMLAYGMGSNGATYGNPWTEAALDNANSNSFGAIGGQGPEARTFTPSAWQYDFAEIGLTDSTVAAARSNVIVVDLAQFLGTSYAPQHLGHRFANLLAVLNFASQDIYKTTFRGPGTVLITSPLMASILESAAKLEGGIAREDGPTNMGTKIEYRGKFAGKYELIVDPMFPDDEIIMGYNGGNPMDAGFVYCPYIPLMPLQTVTNPEDFQPRKGIMTRYGKAAIQPANRFYRVIRLVGAGNYATPEINRLRTMSGTSVPL